MEMIIRFVIVPPSAGRDALPGLLGPRGAERAQRRSEELFFSERNYSAVRRGESDPRLI